MAKWLEQASQLHEMYCHDLDVMKSNLTQVKLGVRSISVLSRTWTKNKNTILYCSQAKYIEHCHDLCCVRSLLFEYVQTKHSIGCLIKITYWDWAIISCNDTFTCWPFQRANYQLNKDHSFPGITCYCFLAINCLLSTWAQCYNETIVIAT